MNKPIDKHKKICYCGECLHCRDDYGIVFCDHFYVCIEKDEDNNYIKCKQCINKGVF